jgi:hypothetical protein
MHMTEAAIRALLADVRRGKKSVEDAVQHLRRMPFEDLDFAKIDHHRGLRQGMPEVIFAAGKRPEQIVKMLRRMLPVTPNILVTRADACVAARVKRLAAAARYHELSRAITIQRDTAVLGKGKVVIISAGTSDIPVAEEAVVTAQIMGNEVTHLYDVGVAGIHRLMSHREVLTGARVLIVVAGMEGALPSVIGGLVGVPVIAVPTSVGYGASFQGLAALLGMLNSCASNVTVVNIDNGFGAGFVASLINRL